MITHVLVAIGLIAIPYVIAFVALRRQKNFALKLLVAGVIWYAMCAINLLLLVQGVKVGSAWLGTFYILTPYPILIGVGAFLYLIVKWIWRKLRSKE